MNRDTLAQINHSISLEVDLLASLANSLKRDLAKHGHLQNCGDKLGRIPHVVERIRELRAKRIEVLS